MLYTGIIPSDLTGYVSWFFSCYLPSGFRDVWLCPDSSNSNNNVSLASSPSGLADMKSVQTKSDLCMPRAIAQHHWSDYCNCSHGCITSQIWGKVSCILCSDSCTYLVYSLPTCCLFIPLALVCRVFSLLQLHVWEAVLIARILLSEDQLFVTLWWVVFAGVREWMDTFQLTYRQKKSFQEKGFIFTSFKSMTTLTHLVWKIQISKVLME